MYISILKSIVCIIFGLIFVNAKCSNNTDHRVLNNNEEIDKPTLEADPFAFFESTDYKELPLSPCHISAESLLADLYRRDSTSIISDFHIYLNPDIYAKTLLNNLPINENQDTIFIHSQYEIGEYAGTSTVQIWNSKMTILADIYGSFKSKFETNLPYWEKELIDTWNIDSISTLTKPTFYNVIRSRRPANYVFQIVIKNRKAFSRHMEYSRLYVPNEFADNPELIRKFGY